MPRSGLPLTVCYLDVDGLKAVNDALGHDEGSRLRRDLARMLLASFRASDVIGRLGGDEFVVLAGGPVEEARAGLARLRAATADFNAGRQRGYLISFAVGEATSAACRETVDELTNRADEAMYKAKRSRGPCDVLVSSH